MKFGQPTRGNGADDKYYVHDGDARVEVLLEPFCRRSHAAWSPPPLFCAASLHTVQILHGSAASATNNGVN